MFIALLIWKTTRASTPCGAGWNVTAGVRVDGLDIKSVSPVASAALCCSECATVASCHAFVFVHSKQLCWLKTASSAKRRADKDCTWGFDPAVPPVPSPTPGPPPSPGCQADADCNGGGRCVAKACECARGWAGEHCEQIKFGPAYACGVGGLCLNHSAAVQSAGARSYADNFTSTWGGEAVQADDDSWHMYAASFGHDAALGSWLSDSRVIHAVSEHPEGPYKLADVALGPGEPGAWDELTQHNPAIQRDPVSGTYLLYYMGSTNNGTVKTGGGECANNPEKKSLCNQRVGLATATHPGGPWLRRPKPILDIGAPGAWDDQFTTNPTPLALANGSVLLLYKARSREDFGKMSTGVAFAETFEGPYRKLGSGPLAGVPGGCEDAGVYQDPQSKIFHIVLHCGCGYLTLWSLDGIGSWQPSKAGTIPWCTDVEFSDGSTHNMSTRQRPKWVRSKNGSVTHLLTGAASRDMHEGQTFTFAQRVLP